MSTTSSRRRKQPARPGTVRLYYYTSKQFGMKSLWERRLKVGTYRDLNDPFELLPYSMPDDEARRIMEVLSGVLSDGHGVLCFSEVWNSNLMWAHYADKHRGVCLGFDIPEDERLTPIKYVKRRLKSPVPLTGKPPEDLQELLTTCLTVKSAGWSYERERRLRVSLDEARDGLYFKKFDEDVALREVVIGARCTLSHEDVADALGQPEQDVEIRKVRAAHTEYTMVDDKSRPPLVVKGLPESLRKSRALADALQRYIVSQGDGIIASGMKVPPGQGLLSEKPGPSESGAQ